MKQTAIDYMDVIRKGHFVPLVLLMLCLVAGPTLQLWAVGALLACGVYAALYGCCGRRKPWWLAAGTAAFTGILLATPVWHLWAGLWGRVCPSVPEPGSTLPFFPLAARLFLGAGLRDELFKLGILFLIYLLGRKAGGPLHRVFAVDGPMDAVLLAIASGLGFAFAQTMFQYAPAELNKATTDYLQSGMELGTAKYLGALVAFQHGLDRSIFQLAGHAAFSGYLGVCFGLGIRNTRRRWMFWGIGLAGAAAVHAIWYAVWHQTACAFVAVIAYAGLMAAIIKTHRLAAIALANPESGSDLPGGDVALDQHAPSSHLVLSCVEGSLSGNSYPVNESKLTIGRDPAQCKVVVPFAAGEISSLHCSVRLTPSGVVLLEDCSSTQGTFLESGEQVMPGSFKRLRLQQRFYLGTPSFMFELAEEI
jgi:RsiW-degrading membrane proteinase PrsW (M82 family)